MKIAIIFLLSSFTFAGAVGTYALVREPKHMLAPCDDAVLAFMTEHFECTDVRYDQKRGLYVSCFGGDYAIGDLIATRKGTVSSLIFRSLRTGQQGVCDCEKPYGAACEVLP